MTFERGCLVLIPFPFNDLSANKQRPVLALTTPDRRGDFIGLPVTSRPQNPPALALTATELASGVLPTESWIRIDHPVTLNASLVRKVVAEVRPDTVTEAVNRLCVVLGTTE